MRLLGLVVLGLVFGRPALAQQQGQIRMSGQGELQSDRGNATPAAVPPGKTVTMADLVGQWAKQGQKEAYVTFRADSTYAPSENGRWHLAGDTLMTGATVEGFVKLEGSVLTVSGPTKDDKPRVYERLATPTP